MNDIVNSQFKSVHRFAAIPCEEVHRIGLFNDLLSVRTHFSYFEEGQFSVTDINEMISDICTT